MSSKPDPWVLNISPAIFWVYPRLLNVFLSLWLLKLLHQNFTCRAQKTHVADVWIPTVKPMEYATSLHYKWMLIDMLHYFVVKWHLMPQNMKHLVHCSPESLGAEQERQTPFSPCRHHSEPEYPRMTPQTVSVEWQTCKIPYAPSLHDSLMANVSMY